MFAPDPLEMAVLRGRLDAFDWSGSLLLGGLLPWSSGVDLCAVEAASRRAIPIFHSPHLHEYHSIDCAVPGYAPWDECRLLLHLLVTCGARCRIAALYRIRDGFPCFPSPGGLVVGRAQELHLAIGS